MPATYRMGCADCADLGCADVGCEVSGCAGLSCPVSDCADFMVPHFNMLARRMLARRMPARFMSVCALRPVLLSRVRAESGGGGSGVCNFFLRRVGASRIWGWQQQRRKIPFYTVQEPNLGAVVCVVLVVM